MRGDQYVVALALIVRGQVAIGVIGCPALAPIHSKAVRWGADGVRHSWLVSLHDTAFTTLGVSACRDPAPPTILRFIEAEHIDRRRSMRFRGTPGVHTPPALTDSQVVCRGRGRADLLIRAPATKLYREEVSPTCPSIVEELADA